MKKPLYTILSICSIAYIACLVINVVGAKLGWGWVGNPWFEAVVNFGGVAIIFAFALVNFAGSPLKTVFFILLVLVIVAYVILYIPKVQDALFHVTASPARVLF